MTTAGRRAIRAPAGLVPLVVVSVVVAAVAAGFTRGVWIANLHNGFLAPSFACVGAYVVHQRPRNRCGWVFLATGAVEATLFLGRQIGHDAAPGTSPWWGWLGVWPLVVALALVTLSVILFPDGRMPSRAWVAVLGAGAALTVLIALASALWAVGYESAGVATRPPFRPPGTGPSVGAWAAFAHTTFAAFQVTWLVAIITRWRTSGLRARRQLGFVGASAAVSIVALGIGLIGWGTPTPGLLAACLVPVAAGWAIVHGQNVATHTAFGWLGHRSDGETLPGELAGAMAQTLGAERVAVRSGSGNTLRVVGTWPANDPAWLDEPGGAAAGTTVAVLDGDGRAIGDLVIDRIEPLSRHDRRLLDGFRAQAGLVLEHLALAARLSDPGVANRLERLTARENEVLALMARGLTNAAICDELHLSIKTVEPAVSSIFAKLDLAPGTSSNRRVLAVRAYLERQAGRESALV